MSHEGTNAKDGVHEARNEPSRERVDRRKGAEED